MIEKINSKKFYALGIMSGTSMDGVDASLILTDGYEFCKVITRRVPVDESAVKTEGDLAAEWMQIAQPWIEPPRISDKA